MPILAVNVLAVNFWLLTVPSPSMTSCQKCIIYPLSVLSEVLQRRQALRGRPRPRRRPYQRPALVQ